MNESRASKLQEWALRKPKGRAEAWYLKHPGVIYDAEFRLLMMAACKAGLQAAIVTRHHTVTHGRLVMKSSSPNTWVMNAGGPHGTPALVDCDNIIYLQGFKAP